MDADKKKPSSSFSWLYLIFFILLAYSPFMGNRVIRVAGDDKVYVAQALEMKKEGRWFVQTLAEEPDYRKGPFHYILLRLGIMGMGNSMWSTVYMNLVLLLLASLALALLVQKYLGKNWAVFSALAFSLNMGIYTHAYTSQMEVELACLLAISLFFLDRCSANGRKDWCFWLIAGLAGTVKSPIHAIFLGVTALLFWLITGEWKERLRSIHAWWGLSLGIGFCLFSYAPAILLDYENFFETYIMRENFSKVSNQKPWYYPLTPLFTYFLIPWMFVSFVAYGDAIGRFFSFLRKPKQRKKISFEGKNRLMLLSLCLLLPSILFFILHPYRGQNYNLPVISGLIILVTILASSANAFWKKIYRGVLFLTALKILALPILLTVLVEHYKPMPFWWNSWTIPILWVCSIWTAKSFIEEATFSKFTKPQVLARNATWFFMGIAVFMSVLGEREMLDLRSYQEEATIKNQKLELSYYNLQKNTWSEWGYLNFWLGFPVIGLHTEADLKDAIEKEKVILVPGEPYRTRLIRFVEKNFPNYKMEERIWKRWQTKVKDRKGLSIWKLSWNKRDFSVLEKEYTIMRFYPPSQK